MNRCEKCSKEQFGKMMEIKTENAIHFFCNPCLFEAEKSLAMLLFKNKDQRKLLKNIRKWLKHTKTN